MTEPLIAFITYTRDRVQYITTPDYEHYFLNWMNGENGPKSTGFVRRTITTVGVICRPWTPEEKKEGTVLSIVPKESTNDKG